MNEKARKKDFVFGLWLLIILLYFKDKLSA